MGRVEGKIAIVTGAGQGIGRAAAQMLAAEGASVAVTDVDDTAGQETVKEIVQAGGEAAFFDLDVTLEEDWERVVEEVGDTYGIPDVLVNNAGIYRIEPLADTTVEDWKTLMDVNVTGVFLGLKHCAPRMEEKGRGSVINLSSVAGLVGLSGHANYGASKGAVRTLTKDAAIELAESGGARQFRASGLHRHADGGLRG